MSERDASLGTGFLLPLVPPSAPSARPPPLAFPQEQPLGLWPRCQGHGLPPRLCLPFLTPPRPLPGYSLLPKGRLPFLSFIHSFVCITNIYQAPCYVYRVLF